MKVILLPALALAAVGAAHAQPGGGAPGGAGGMPATEVIISNNDGNGDGEITREEAAAAGLALSQNWDMFDLNSDGKVVAEELDQVRARFAGGFGGGPGGGGPGGPGAAAGGDAADDDEEADEDN